jgi:hypothetical protein
MPRHKANGAGLAAGVPPVRISAGYCARAEVLLGSLIPAPGQPACRYKRLPIAVAPIFYWTHSYIWSSIEIIRRTSLPGIEVRQLREAIPIAGQTAHNLRGETS